MEYGIWSLHAAGGLWGDPRLARRHPILGPGGPVVPGTAGAAFALNALRRPVDAITMPVPASSPVYRAMELVTRTTSATETTVAATQEKQQPVPRSDNESNFNIERRNDRQGNDDDDDDDNNDENSSHVSWFRTKDEM